MYPFAAVLFDMDGVVVDNMPLHRTVWTEFARASGLNPTEAEIRALDGRRAADIIRAFWGEALDDDEIARRSHAREMLYAERLGTAELHAVPGVVAYLEALGRLGVPRILATSAIPANVERMLGRLKLEHCFEGVVTAADVTHGKPHPEVYLKAAALAGVPAARCLVVEDALPGVSAAKAAGATCLGLMTSEDADSLRGAGADMVAPDFTGLPAVLVPQLPVDPA